MSNQVTTPATTEWPMAKFYFRVRIEGLPDIGFQTVEGLEVEQSVMEYRSGHYEGFFKTKRPGMLTYANVTFKKGVFEDDNNLHEFFKLYYDHQLKERKEIELELLDESGTAIYLWKLYNCFVTKFTPTSMDADADSEVAIEELEISCEHWEQTP
jgi:phage tail-like protein